MQVVKDACSLVGLHGNEEHFLPQLPRTPNCNIGRSLCVYLNKANYTQIVSEVEGHLRHTIDSLFLKISIFTKVSDNQALTIDKRVVPQLSAKGIEQIYIPIDIDKAFERQQVGER